MVRFAFLFLTLTLLTACGGNFNFRIGDEIEGTPEELMARGLDLRERRRYDRALLHFSELERQYPLNPLAIQAQFETGVTHYSAQDYSEGVAAFDRFLRFNPGNALEVEAEYLRARCFYDEIPDVFRDQGVTRRALEAFEGLIEKFPGTTQALDAERKLVLVRDQLAGHEMVVGRNYLGQGAYLAAQNRFKVVIEEYGKTAQVPEAFYRLVETSIALGLLGEARQYGATLGFNFPTSPWYRKAYDLLTAS